MFGLSGPMLALVVALGLSLAGNAVITHAYLGARDDAAVATTDANNSRTAAKACSEGVESLRASAEQRAAEAETARDAANLLARDAQRRAQDLLSKRPSVPADDCRSAAVQMDEWLTNRNAK